VESVLPEVNIQGITHKVGTIRKTAHSFDKKIQGDYGQVRDVIVVESYLVEFTTNLHNKSISSFVCWSNDAEQRENDIAKNTVTPI
jgi:hypothetical protein